MSHDRTRFISTTVDAGAEPGGERGGTSFHGEEFTIHVTVSRLGTGMPIQYCMVMRRGNAFRLPHAVRFLAVCAHRHMHTALLLSGTEWVVGTRVTGAVLSAQTAKARMVNAFPVGPRAAGAAPTSRPHYPTSRLHLLYHGTAERASPP